MNAAKQTIAVALILCGLGAFMAKAGEGDAAVEINVSRLESDARAQRVELLFDARNSLTEWKKISREISSAKIDKTMSTEQSDTSGGRAIAFRDKEAKKNAAQSAARFAKEISDEIALAQSGKPVMIPFLRLPYASGQVGRLQGTLDVFQVMDDKSFLGRKFLEAPGIDIPVERGSDGKQMIWIEGVSTRGMSDERTVDLSSRDIVLMYTGTKVYKAVSGGSNAVPAFRALNADEMESARKILNPASAR